MRFSQKMFDWRGGRGKAEAAGGTGAAGGPGPIRDDHGGTAGGEAGGQAGGQAGGHSERSSHPRASAGVAGGAGGAVVSAYTVKREAPPADMAISAMRREHLLDRILTMNATATPEFLDQFDEEGLRVYLERLTWAQDPRDRSCGWVRRPEGRAIVGHVRGL